MRYIKRILFVFLLLLIVGCDVKEIIPKFKYEDVLNMTSNEKEININEYTIYGKHFNIKIDLLENVSLVLKNDDVELMYPLFMMDDVCSVARYINDGLNLDKVPIGEYVVLLKEEIDGKVNYYNFINNTSYGNMEYYTMTSNLKNNLINIGFDTFNNKNYMYLEVKETVLPSDVYDIILDPGHGGKDSGAVNGKYQENSLNLEYAMSLKEALEEEGFKVRLTRTTTTEELKTYGVGSRTAIPYESKAKLMLSLHLNSSDSKKNTGVEIYTAYDDDITFAKKIADNIVKETSSDYSINPLNRVSNGVYTRIYEQENIKSTYNQAIREGWTPYNIKPNTTYYYFIRETGGILTKAFADGRNTNYEANPYYNANYGVEAYLIESGYISNNDNLKIILNEKDNYVKALKNSILEYVKEEL